MECKTCLTEKPEADFKCSRNKYEGHCYKCVFKMKGGEPIESLKKSMEHLERGICKICQNKFTAISPDRKYNTNAKYCSAECRKKGELNVPSRKDRRQVRSEFGFSWKKQNFEFRKDTSHVSLGVHI